MRYLKKQDLGEVQFNKRLKPTLLPLHHSRMTIDSECVDRIGRRLVDHDNLSPIMVTNTTKTQSKAQNLVVNHFQRFLDNLDSEPAAFLDREKFVNYCLKGLEEMSPSYQSLGKEFKNYKTILTIVCFLGFF